jgi:uncharacterized protein YjbI with pentapeptide repeats
VADGKKPDVKKIDPFDVEALEKSLNDSATRVSTIWVSFLIFALYLLIAATTVDHRQLLLAEPVRLPVLNIDLPLWGFFFLAPILFVIFHLYVLLQVLLLGRTATAYNGAIDRAVKPPFSNATVRQRLANTLFAQIFAGSPEEREGWLGSLLHAMAWITLAIAPVLILLTFQFAFLSYHSHIVTWTHRLLILTELVCLFLLWPLVLNAPPNTGWRRLRQWVFLFPSGALFVFLALSIATFPGEPHVNLFTGQGLSSVQCERWFSQNFDRLHLPGVDVVDDERLAKIVKATADRKLPAYQGERTRNFRGRDLNCADLSFADLRRVDLINARLTGANLTEAALEEASLDGAHLRGAVLGSANLRSATVAGAELQGANLGFAQLPGSFLVAAHLQGANLKYATLQGANLNGAELRGAVLDNAFMQAASLEGAQLAGASLDGANLQGASFRDVNAPREGRDSYLAAINYGNITIEGKFLRGAQLQGASLERASLQGASLDGVQLQGASINEANLDLAELRDVYVWRTKELNCGRMNLVRPKTEAIIEASFAPDEPDKPDKPTVATPDEITRFIERTIADIPNEPTKYQAQERLRAGLIVDQTNDDTQEIAKFWNDCESAIKKKQQKSLDDELAHFLRDLACNARDNRKAIAEGVAGNWAWPSSPRGLRSPIRRNFVLLLARGLLSEDGKNCAATKDLNEQITEALRGVIAEAANAPPESARPTKSPR